MWFDLSLEETLARERIADAHQRAARHRLLRLARPPAGTGTVPGAVTTPPPSNPIPGAARTRLLLEGPIVSTLLRLGAPNVVVNVVLIAVTATVDAYFVGRLGSSALAGLTLVFPVIML